MTKYIALAIWLMAAAVLPAQNLPEGVKSYSTTLTVKRANPKISVPPPFVGSNTQTPGDELLGVGMARTVLLFSDTAKPQFIKSGDYGQGIGYWWNDGASKACQSAAIHDLTIIGRAKLHNSPYSSNLPAGQPDPYGPDFVPYSDGITLEGSGSRVYNVTLSNVPGTAIVLRPGDQKQVGAKGAWDEQAAYLADVHVQKSYRGIENNVNDARFTRCEVHGVVKEGLVNNGPGAYYTDCHVWGADTGTLLNAITHLANHYSEAARIGTHVTSKAAGSRISGLQLGPGTCWQRGLILEANSCETSGLQGTVPGDGVGVYIGATVCNNTISGQLNPGMSATGVVMRGHHNRIQLVAGWGESTPTLVEVVEPIYGSTIEITGGGVGGCVLDLSASQLDKHAGKGNRLVINWNDWKGTTTIVRYPGGGTKYNLAAGNKVIIDGVEQQ